ncbi:hypothetical protein RAS2_00330 [Phycisphaerae bacterium RAS2]|nr:hypothetical protein RAS2_00330 [Phycisphaerae bacterium RAS2]
MSRLGQPPLRPKLAGFLRQNADVPSIRLECVMKSAGLIESMGRDKLGARKTQG